MMEAATLSTEATTPGWHEELGRHTHSVGYTSTHRQRPPHFGRGPSQTPGVTRGLLGTTH